MIDFVGRRKWYFIASAAVILVGVIALGVLGLNWGIEFTSGSVMTLDFEQPVTGEQLRGALATLGHEEAIVQGAEGDTFMVRTAKLAEDAVDPTTGEHMSEEEWLRRGLEESFGPVEIVSSYDVSPSLARDIVNYASYAVALAAVGILVYITWAFRRLVRPFRFGVTAIIALVHDVLIVLGCSALLGMEVDAMFITAILTVVGYSVNDTIVVFDRIRENAARASSQPLEFIVNSSIMEVMGRSLNTSLSTLFVLLALFLFGGATIHNFVLVLIIGVVVGTYSSIFVASQLLVVWERNDLGRLFRRVIPRRASA